MMDPTGLAIIAGKEVLDSTKPQQGIFWNYVFLNWFGGKKMLISNEITKAESENAYELKKIEGKITQHQIIQALQSADNEIEYQNLFGTLQKVLPKLNPGKQEQQVDPDKMKRLKDLSKEFSSDDMQEYIAGILAGEYNKPGTYSLQTMSLVKNLSINEINLFRKFCGLVIDGDFIFGNFFQLGNENHPKLAQKGIDYTDYLYLQELGLVTGSDSATKMGNNSQISSLDLKISNKKLKLWLKKEITLQGKSLLTKAGKEIFNLVEPIFDEELFEITKKELIRQGFEEIT